MGHEKLITMTLERLGVYMCVCVCCIFSLPAAIVAFSPPLGYDRGQQRRKPRAKWFLEGEKVEEEGGSTMDDDPLIQKK